MQEADLQKDIARYREELLALAARRPPQAEKKRTAISEASGSAFLAQAPANSPAQPQENANSPAQPQENANSPAQPQENANGPAQPQENANGPAQPQENANGPAEAPEMEKPAESMPERAGAKGQAACPPLIKREAGAVGPQENAIGPAETPKMEEPAESPPPQVDAQETPSAGPMPGRQPEQTGQAGRKGWLWVRVVTAHGLQPVKGALVTVSLVEQQLQTLLTSLYSDAGGRAGCEVPLAGAPEGERPCAYCHIRVDKPGYFTCHAYRVPVYEGEPAAQCARLLPLPGLGQVGHYPRP